MLGKERHNNEVDKEFTDFAWGKMGKLLDKEMPVAAKQAAASGRSKYLLLFLLLFISFSAGLGSMFFYMQSKGEPKPEAPPPEENIAYANAPDVFVFENQNIIESEGVQKKRSEIKNSNPGQNSIVNLNSINEVNFTLNKNSSNSPLSNNSTFIEVASEKISDVHKALLNQFSKSLLEAELEPVQPFAESKAINTYFNSIDLLDAKDVVLASNEKKEVLELDLVKQKRKKFDIGLAVGALFGEDLNFSGAQTGFVLDFNLDKKFAVNSGLYLTRLNKNAYQAPRGLTTDDYLEQAAFGGTPGAPVTSINADALNSDYAANFPIERMDYLTLPLTVSYNFNRKIGFQTGLSVSYLLSSQSNEESVGSNDPTRPPSNTATLRGYSQYLSKHGIKSLDVGIGIGMQYLLTQNLGMDMNYTIGLPDYTKDKVFGIREGHTNNYFKLSLKYQLGKF